MKQGQSWCVNAAVWMQDDVDTLVRGSSFCICCWRLGMLHATPLTPNDAPRFLMLTLGDPPRPELPYRGNPSRRRWSCAGGGWGGEGGCLLWVAQTPEAPGLGGLMSSGEV